MGESASEGEVVVNIVVANAVAVRVVVNLIRSGLEGGERVAWGLEKGGGIGGFVVVVVVEEEEEERKDEWWRMVAIGVLDCLRNLWLGVDYYYIIVGLS